MRHHADDGRVVGCDGICCQREMPSPDNPSGTCDYLMNVLALPKPRGRGIDRRVSSSWSTTRDCGTNKIYLESSEVARPLYHSVGFRDLPNYMKP